MMGHHVQIYMQINVISGCLNSGTIGSCVNTAFLSTLHLDGTVVLSITAGLSLNWCSLIKMQMSFFWKQVMAFLWVHAGFGGHIQVKTVFRVAVRCC